MEASQEVRSHLWTGILKSKVEKPESLSSLPLRALIYKSQGRFMLASSSSWQLLLSLNPAPALSV